METKEKRKPVSQDGSTTQKVNWRRKFTSRQESCEEHKQHGELQSEISPESVGRPHKKQRTPVNIQLCKRILHMLVERGDKTSCVVPRGNVYHIISEQGDRVCVCDPTGCTVHSSNNAKVIVTAAGELWFHCSSDRCGTPVSIGTIKGGSNTFSVHVDRPEASTVAVDCMSVSSSSSSCVAVESNVQQHEAGARVSAHQALLRHNATVRPIQVVATRCPFMDCDPQFDVTKPQGNQLLQKWGNHVVAVTGFQGCGKTYWMSKTALEVLRQNPGQKVVVVGPFISLAMAMKGNLTDAARARIERDVKSQIGALGRLKKIQVHFYQDPLPDENSWDVLVVCPMSLFKFRFQQVCLVVVDELSSLNAQLIEWTSSDTNTTMSITRAIDMLRSLFGQAHRSLICGAQADQRQREIFLALMEIPPTVPMLLYRHHDAGPITVVDLLDSRADFLDRVWSAVRDGGRAIVNVRQATEGSRIAKWLIKKLDAHNSASRHRDISVTSSGDTLSKGADSQENALVLNVVVWTAAWLAAQRDKPALDVTEYVNTRNIHVFIHTNAFGPGMSLNQPKGFWTFRGMLLSNEGGGAGEQVLAQMPNRVRNIDDRTVYMYIKNPQRNWRGSHTQEDEDRVMRAACNAFVNDTQTNISSSGHSQRTLKPGIRNDLRLENELERQRTNGCVTAAGIVENMDNASLLSPSTSREMHADPEYLEVCEEEKRHNKDNLYLEPGEFNRLFGSTGVTPNQTIKASIDSSAQNVRIAEGVPPQFVGSMYKNEYSLTKDAFQILRDNYTRLCVTQRLFKQIAGQVDMERWTTLAQLSKMHRVPAASVMDEVDTAEVVIHHLLLLAGMDEVDVSAQMGTNRILVTPQDADKTHEAYKWVRDNWHVVTRATVKATKTWPKCAPPKNKHEAYRGCLKRVLKVCTGMGLVKKRGVKTPGVYKLEFRSFWNELGIKSSKYAEWLVSSVASDFGACPLLMTQCDLCGTDGPQVSCIMQGGMWRCTVKSNRDTEAHRELYEPVDVGSMERFRKIVHERNRHQECMQPSMVAVEEILPDDIQLVLVRRLLRFFGFEAGLVAGGMIEENQALRSMQRSTLDATPAEIMEFRHRYQLNIEDARTCVDLAAIAQLLRVVVQGTGYTVSLSRKTRALSVQRTLTIICVANTTAIQSYH
jgi:hypothetical protein